MVRLITSCALARLNMQITKEFLEYEISELETEAQKAQTFLTQAQATIQAYKMLINRLDAPELEQLNDDAI
jgi:hypothetical protein